MTVANQKTKQTNDHFVRLKSTQQYLYCKWILPNAWRLGFLAKKFLGFLTFLAKILAIILGKVRKILQDFSRSWKEIQENFWTSWQENQDYPRSWQENHEKLASNNTRSIDIL